VSRRPLPAPTGSSYRVGMVCLGNICRSPTAEVVLRRRLEDAGIGDRVTVGSCGTGPWHVGEPMDSRAAAHLTAAGYDASAHRGRQLDETWSGRDLLLAMDADNLAGITGGAGETDRVRLFRSFDPEVAPGSPTPDLPDPYYGGDDGFAAVLDIVERTCDRLVDELEALGIPDP
jgi:protein-tyrosine phosphatase